MYDVIIIGRGPAGYSAGIYLARAGRKVLIIGKWNKIWDKSVKINNYFGVGETNGLELMEAAEAQVKGFGAKIIDSLVTKVESGDNFKVFADKIYEGKNLLIATGAPIQKKVIPNESDFIGRGVSYCVPCDGFFFKNKKVFVIGNTGFAVSEAIELLDYTKDVTLVTNGLSDEGIDKLLLKRKGVKIKNFKIDKIVGDKKLEGVITSKGELKVDGLFITSGDAGSSDFSRMLGVLIKEGKIKVDDNMMTNVQYVWAAGDCTKGVQQIATAVGEGAIAGLSIIKEGRK
jgi:thioredoxin reductase (NADPH)